MPRFSNDAIITLRLAHQESQRLNKEMIEPMDILVGLVKSRRGAVARFLIERGVDLRSIRDLNADPVGDEDFSRVWKALFPEEDTAPIVVEVKS